MDIKEYKDYLKRNINSAWYDHGIFAAELVKYLQPEVIVDLGVDEGYSSFCFAAYNVGDVYGIDSFTGDTQTGAKYTLPKVVKLQYYVKENYDINNVYFIPGLFEDVLGEWKKEIDILHIDGFHSEEAVKNDYEKWTKFCHSNSIIMFHDVLSHKETVGNFFINLPGYKILREQSSGLGILTLNEDLYKIINKLSDDFPE